MTCRSEESSKGEYSKAMWEAAAIAVGGRDVLLSVQINQVQADIPSCQVSPFFSLRHCCSGKPFSPSSFIPLNCSLKCALFLANDVALLCYINEFVI